MITLPEGKMKSREGKVVDADDLILEIKNLSREEIKKRAPDISEKELEERAEKIAIGAIKFYFLRVGANQNIEFNPEESVSFDGFTGPYCQYAYARICSVLRQQPANRLDSYSLLNCEKEIALLKHIGQFTSVVADAAKTRAPHKICNYIQKLAQYFHSFYASNKIWDENNLQLSKERLALIEATRITLKNALDLIGVSSPERM